MFVIEAVSSTTGYSVLVRDDEGQLWDCVLMGIAGPEYNLPEGEQFIRRERSFLVRESTNKSEPHSYVDADAPEDVWEAAAEACRRGDGN